MTALSQPAVVLARRFLGWWREELAAMLPARLRAVLATGPRWLLVPAPGTLVLAQETAEGVREIGRAPSNDEAALRRLLARPGRGAAVALRLPPEQTLALEMTLPLAAERNLDEVVALELERRTPFTAGEVHAAHRVLARDRGAGTLRLRVVLVLRAAVAAALAAVAHVTNRPGRLEAADGTPLPLPGEGRRCRPLVPVLAVLVAVLGIAAVLVPLHQRRELAARLEADLAQARAQAEAVAGLRAGFEELVAAEARPFERKSARPAVVLVVEDLSRRLPDDTWLLHLRLSGEEIEMTGFSAAAAPLVERLEASPLLRDVRFRSPVTRDPRRQAERFHLSATLEGSS